jgi:hypothetical protein
LRKERNENMMPDPIILLSEGNPDDITLTRMEIRNHNVRNQRRPMNIEPFSEAVRQRGFYRLERARTCALEAA